MHGVIRQPVLVSVASLLHYIISLYYIILYYIILYYIVWCAGHARRDTAAGARRDPGEEHPPRRGAPRILYIKLLLSYNNIIR